MHMVLLLDLLFPFYIQTFNFGIPHFITICDQTRVKCKFKIPSSEQRLTKQRKRHARFPNERFINVSIF